MLATAQTRTVQEVIAVIDLPLAVVDVAAAEPAWLAVNPAFADAAGGLGPAPGPVTAGLPPERVPAAALELELGRRAAGPFCLANAACLAALGEGWRAVLRPLPDRRGRVRRLLLLGVDARVADRLRESEERYRALVQMSPDTVSILDGDRILFTNPAGARLVGVPEPGQLVGRSVLEFVHPDDRERMEARLREVAEQEEPLTSSEWRVLRADGRPVTVETVASRIVWQGRPALQVCARDISERKAAQERIEHLALHDHLTGVANRAQFERELERSCARARRAGTSVAVIFLDLDRFKEVNDRLGHAAGDELLRAVADRLVANVREGDLVARLGGDEFAVVAPDQPPGEGYGPITQRLARLFEVPFTVAGQELAVGASIGVAVFPRHTDRPERLLALADRAMYRGKEASRQRQGTAAVTTFADAAS